MGAGHQVLHWICHSVKLEFHSCPPAPYTRQHQLVEPQDIDFTLDKIAEGYHTRAHGLIPLDSHGSPCVTIKAGLAHPSLLIEKI
jgi:hypothetical protein